MKEKLSKVSLFWKIWVSHILIYFLLVMTFLIIKDHGTDDGVFRGNIILLLLKSTVIGLFGFLDGIGFLVILSMIIMYLINLYIQRSYLSYVLSLALTYPVFMQFCNEGYGSDMITISSLALTAVVNMLIFRKHLMASHKD